ncbi:MAG: PilC/PilY family type IV pilus protein [Pseudomonadota bacterium]
MVSEKLNIYGLTCLTASMVSALFSADVSADDTEIYRTNPALANERAQIILIFDDSGSMSTVIEGVRAQYDPDNASYTYDGINKLPGNRIYWSAGDTFSPPDPDSPNYFEIDSNRCATSLAPLRDPGYVVVSASRWFEGENLTGDGAGWLPLSSLNTTPTHVDCLGDVIASNQLNPGVADGYPQNTSVDGSEYGPSVDASVDWSNAYTFYSANYLDYWHDTSVIVDRTRLDIAQSIITDTISASPTIDFGLALFNQNNGDDINDRFNGGRIVQALVNDLSEEERDTQRTALIDAINATTANGSTPLCETTMEVYRYLAGSGVVYGNQKHPTDDLAPRDSDAESPAGTYQSPISTCSTFIVLVTDGLPRYDSDANAAIKQLINAGSSSCQTYLTDEMLDGEQLAKENCLPDLAAYMANNDLDGDDTNGVQSVTRLFTVGFQLEEEAAPLMLDTALSGNGKYIAASNPEELDAAFKEIILSILTDGSTFTSPAVAVNTFTRTQSRNEVFFAMFQPDERVDWPGNIKRLNVEFGSEGAVLVDDNGDAAIDPISGQISTTAVTAWGNNIADGPDVLSGGVGAVLAARDPASRVILSNTGTNGALQDFGSANMTASAFDSAWSELDLYDYFGVADETEFLRALDWGRGYENVDDGAGNLIRQPRSWILADILHSRPLVVNYGARNSTSEDDLDLRIVVGTNAGFLHMFNNEDGAEDWAFFAKELAPLLNIRRVNEVDDDHYYGIDSPPVLYLEDLNVDGTIDSDAGDKAYVYTGLRRGGRILYALDISNPDNPALLWQNDQTDAGFDELGQTWSVPVVAKIPGYADDNGVAKPVLIFGAGYDDVNKDSAGLASPDSQGRGLFIVDAVTGDLVWSVTPAANSETNLQETALVHSVAAPVSILDSNGDTLTDRVYFADTGGQLWRVDLPGNELPDANQNQWRIVKLASVNGGTRATDRRFFNAPDVVRTAYAGAAFDAILIGSGDRTNPNDVDDPNDPNLVAVDNQFYMIRDLATNPYFTEAPTPDECSANPPSVDFRCQLPLDPNDLYDVTDNAIELGSEAERSAAEAALIAADGWRLDLQADGEKALASSITVAGKVFFTTFSPDSGAADICEPIPGAGRLYVVDLITAAGEFDFDNNGNTDRAWIIGALLPDTPSPHFGEDGEIRLLLPPGSGGGGEVISPFLTGGQVPKPRGSYWFREDY